MGHHTFSVGFVHYLISRQLVTKKNYELWWIYSGKPIRYEIEDFALVTGLNCSPIGGSEDMARPRKKVRGGKKGGGSMRIKCGLNCLEKGEKRQLAGF